MYHKQLSEKDIRKVQGFAREKLTEYCKWNDVIGTNIFSILEKNNKVLYYPLEDQMVWGFSETIRGKSFVCINTSLPYDKQVFAAAHELYHVWFGTTGEIMISADAQEPDADEEVEMMANRFAAEFLVNEELLRQEMKVFEISRDHLDVKGIIRLANLFIVPYKTMVKRLYETGIISRKEFENFMACTEEQIEVWHNRLGLSMPVRKDKIGLSDLIDKGMDLYERHLITYEKLEYLLEFAELTPEKMGIQRRKAYQPPTDEEGTSLK